MPPAPTAEKVVNRFDEILAAYERHEAQEHGLAATTLSRYGAHCRKFLSRVFAHRPLDLTSITGKDIMGFVLEYAGKCGSADASMMVCSIRSFLRFLVFQGHMRAGLVECVPAVPSERHKRIPSHLSSDELTQLLASCRTKRPSSTRNYAILLLLARLGLRASEVAGLCLDDIDWEHGQLTIQGKGNRQTSLPLPKDVGKALVSYLRRARPRCSSSRKVFIGARTPFRPLKNGSVVSSIVNRAVKRAGLNPEKKGAHLLRPTLATACLRKGATLGEIGHVLRHESINTTAIYAKVDFPRLASLVVQWPEGSSGGEIR